MKILVFGGTGQLGRALRRSLAVLGEVAAPPRADVDLLQPERVAAAVAASGAGVVVNAAAWTDVDGAEAQPGAAQAVNADAVEAMARACAGTGAWLVHYSSDYVYDGLGDRPWREDDPPGPLSVYGRTKLAGDQAAMARTPRHLVLRAGWLYEPGHRNFMTSLLQAAQARDTLEVVTGQWGTPTRAAWLAGVTAQVLQAVVAHPKPARLAGLYHVAAGGYTDRIGYAQQVLATAVAHGMPLRAGPAAVRAGGPAANAGVARRPLNCRLDTTRLRATFGVQVPAWQNGVFDAVRSIAQAGAGKAA